MLTWAAMMPPLWGCFLPFFVFFARSQPLFIGDSDIDGVLQTRTVNELLNKQALRFQRIAGVLVRATPPLRCVDRQPFKLNLMWFDAPMI